MKILSDKRTPQILRIYFVTVINCLILIIIISITSFFSTHEQILVSNSNFEISLHADYFMVEGKSNPSVYIYFRDVDEICLKEKDIILRGFSGNVTYFNVGKFSVMQWSNITNNANVDTKTIEIREGIAITPMGPSPAMVFSPHITIISMQKFVLISVLFVLLFNAILTALTFSVRKYKIENKICFWINSFVLGYMSYSWLLNVIMHRPNYIIFSSIILLLSFGVLYQLLLAKQVLGNVGYTFFIIVLSSMSIALYSHIFTLHYLNSEYIYNTIPYKNIIIPAEEIAITSFSHFAFIKRRLTRQLAYVEFSFRYYFTFPPDEFYDWVSIIQFIIGKMYEMVMLGSIANLILRYIRRKKHNSHKRLHNKAVEH